MAVYVLISFDDESEAKDFCGIVLDRRPQIKLWGIFKKPTQFCECVGGRKTVSGFTRGLNYGWWVCAKCKKPTKLWASGRQWFSVLGTNLLPKGLRPYPDEMSPTLESPKVWKDLETPVMENP